ncbi:hypothetical protein F443_22849 [Phytophthora nicotianae P1569]|uniref:Uncharacterized protein n=1 Tax=Phytophthora nicotianae P1569 TaxID=1317065 RepID=V9DTR2_PHYNI|nr:hypothetical protein F443_22849 [Phytophthora nicotianae P1569]
MESQDQRPPEQAVGSSPDHSRPLRTRSHPPFSPYSSTTRPLLRETRSLDSSTLPTAIEESQSIAEENQEFLYLLLVKPIVKTTVRQRDTSGNMLRDTVKSENSLEEILQQLWYEFTPRVKGRAVKTDGVWTREEPNISEWWNVMQFKVKKHVVDVSKTESAWNLWLFKMRGQTVKLLIYEYGADIARAQDLEDFRAAHVVPDTDRAGAPSERSLGDVVQSLKEAWITTFQAEDVVWPLRGNHVTRNLDRSTWDAMIQQPPPQQLVHLFRPASTSLEGFIMSSYAFDGEAFGQRPDMHKANLETRKAVIVAFIRDLAPPSPSSVQDPMIRLENAEDVDHAD